MGDSACELSKAYLATTHLRENGHPLIGVRVALDCFEYVVALRAQMRPYLVDEFLDLGIQLSGPLGLSSTARPALVIADLTTSTMSSVAWCSHSRTTVQPASAKSSLFRRSRLILPASLFAHHSPFATGCVAWRGHPCQKHPSTNTATLKRRKTRSASHRRSSIGR
jgi:hypothetical protein